MMVRVMVVTTLSSSCFHRVSLNLPQNQEEYKREEICVDWADAFGNQNE